MILKDAYRYQNFLSGMLDAACYYLNSRANVVITRQEHMRSKAHPEATDETLDDKANRKLAVPVDHIINFAVELIDEKQRLSAAIDEAKASFCRTVDRDLAMNKSRRNFISTLRTMSLLKNGERMTSGTAYCFNAEGTQVPYRYDIKETTEIDFNRKLVKRLLGSLSSESDSASNRADRAMTSVEVDHEPKYDINDSFEDLVEAYSKSITEE